MDGMIGEIRLWGPSWAPLNWALCEGQLLSISQNNALFSILGVTYGGDGRSTFALPNIKSRVVVHTGLGPGLSDYRLGQMLGQQTVTLSTSEMPIHHHEALATDSVNLELKVNGDGGDSETPQFNFLAQETNGVDLYNPTANTTMNADAITGNVGSSATLTHSGSSQSHSNIQPFTVVNFIICLDGVYPVRT